MDPKAFTALSQQAFNDRDVETLSKAWHKDFWYEGPGESRTGADKHAASEHVLWTGFPDIRVQIDPVLNDDSTLVMRGRMTGTHTGDFAVAGTVVPPSGRKVEINFLAVMEFDGETALGERVYYDRLELMDQLGLLSEAA